MNAPVEVHMPEQGAAGRLHDAIHELAQPLTTLMFVLEMGRMQHRPESLRGSLDTAVEECRRALAALEDVRAAAAVCAPLPEEEYPQ